MLKELSPGFRRKQYFPWVSINQYFSSTLSMIFYCLLLYLHIKNNLFQGIT